MAGDWLPVTGACQALGISERTLRRHAKEGKIKSKIENNRRLFWIETDRQETGTLPEDNRRIHELEDKIKDLEARIQTKDQALEQARQAAEEASQRHDTIVLQLSKQMEQAQRMLEAHESEKRGPWWKRLFRKK
jgi:predicted site-specific integrase-resolvase